MFLIARKENLSGFSTDLTGQSKNLDPTGNPTGRSTRPVQVDPTGAGRPDRFPSLVLSCFHSFSNPQNFYTTQLFTSKIENSRKFKISKFQSKFSGYFKKVYSSRENVCRFLGFCPAAISYFNLKTY